MIAVCYGCLVAQDIGAHQLERLVELLTPQECEDLLRTLSHPEENIFQHVEKLSPENNQLHTQSRAKRAAASSAAGKVSTRTRPETQEDFGSIYPDRPAKSNDHVCPLITQTSRTIQKQYKSREFNIRSIRVNLAILFPTSETFFPDLTLALIQRRLNPP